ncbi:hypothetical protein BKA66DRAFT_444743 [Pyrenochaeta sp. MPI-SDFR-AT-0127]|nr:hypothetical protein BKA66DRAFT_444743 [Pyrenochaeta sp. MPI-SDFR-AT-0127]
MAHTKGSPDVITKTSFEYLYNHLFLPRKLSGADDASRKNEGLLLDFVLQSLQRFLPDRHDAKAINAAPVAVLQITEQNAGVLISRYADAVYFEMLELSPTNEAVTSTRGRLVRSFPTNAVEISLPLFRSEAFRMVIAKTLTKMSQQSLRETKQKQRGNQEKEQEETVDTTDPMIITELFTSMLRGCGKAVSAQGIRKSTRDEIIWKDSKAPWQRSPLWLLTRVALQLTMTRHSKAEDDTYKEFMAFLMAQALHAANQQQKTSSDVIKVMSTKVSKRLSKLHSPSDGPWLLSIRKIVSKSLDTLNQRWRQLRERAEPSLNLQGLSRFNMMDNTVLSFKEMDSFLSSIALHKTVNHRPIFRPPSTPNILSQSQLPTVADCPETDLPLHLIEIESWVADNLPTWIDSHMKKVDHPVRELKQLLEKYHRKALEYYSGRPEAASRMILTIGELWLAADVAAVHEIPLLANYNPQIPTMVWQALLLGSVQEMQRLKRIEDYVTARGRLAQKLENPAIFFSFGEPGSFAVEYYRQSMRHQKIKREIEEEAYEKEREKSKSLE